MYALEIAKILFDHVEKNLSSSSEFLTNNAYWYILALGDFSEEIAGIQALFEGIRLHVPGENFTR